MSMVGEINKIWKAIADLRRQTSKLPSRISTGGGGSGGGGRTSALLEEVETVNNLPPALTTPRTKMYKVRTGAYANGIAYIFDDGINDPEWHFLNYWT